MAGRASGLLTAQADLRTANRAEGQVGTRSCPSRTKMAATRDLTSARIPANGCRVSRYDDLTESDLCPGQEWQIVQSCKDLRDFLP